MYICDNSTYVFKLADFGIARGIPGPGIAVTIIGSRGFAAPEVEGGLPYNQKADMYSLGKCMGFIHDGTQASGLWWQLRTNLTDLDPCRRQNANEVYRSIRRHLEQRGNHNHHGHSIRPQTQQPRGIVAPFRFDMRPHPTPLPLGMQLNPTPPPFGMSSHPTQPPFCMQPIQSPLRAEPPLSIFYAPASTAFFPLPIQFTTGNVGGPRSATRTPASMLSPQDITASFRTARGSLSPFEVTGRRWSGQ